MKFHVHRASRNTHRPRAEALQAPPGSEPAKVPDQAVEPRPVIDLREDAPERPDVSH